MSADTVALFKKGNIDAFAVIFKAWYATLCYYARGKINDAHSSEDIVQECMLKLWEKHADFESADKIKAFLYVAVYNKCKDHMRRMVRRQKHDREVLLSTNTEIDMFRALYQAELVREVRHEIRLLPQQCGKIMQLSYEEGMTVEEIAQALQLSPHTVKNQRTRGRELLKRKMGDVFPVMCALLASIFSITKS